MWLDTEKVSVLCSEGFTGPDLALCETETSGQCQSEEDADVA